MKPFNIFDQIKSNVDTCGLHIFGIFGTEKEPGFTYTVGFAAHGLPEVIVFALDARMITPFLNRYYHEIVVEKTRLAGPAVLEGEDWFNHPLSVINCERDKVREYGCQAFNYAEAVGWNEPDFVQWVWTDETGKLPWQTGFNESMRDAQPILCKVM